MALKLFKKSHSKVEDTIDNILPKDSLLKVFSYLDVKSLNRCAQVSKGWNELAKANSNWKNIDLSHFEGDDELDLMENIFYRWGGTIRELSLRGCQSVDYSLIQTLAQSCHSIEVLNLSGCRRVNDIACRYLSLYCCRLTTLNLDSCSLITDETLKGISIGCVFMESLNISWCNRITQIGIIEFASECHMLRIFLAKGCPGVTSNAITALATNCPYLEVCNFFSCNISDDSVVSRLARKCRSLRSIGLSGCTVISDDVLMALAEYCPNLNTLEVAKCRALTDEGFRHLAKECKKLKIVDLEECVISDATLGVLGKHCPKLEQLCISKCSLITDLGISMLSDGGCVKHLTVLEMHYCRLLTDSCVDSLIKFSKMKRMELFECEKISRAAIEKLKNRLFSIIAHSIDEGHSD